jgi:formylglycine-generating enzyme required for sulfatase activity
VRANQRPGTKIVDIYYDLTDLDNAWVKWDENGYRLPTEAEWEKAARGGLTWKRFSWGDTISHSQANYYSIGESYDVSPTRGSHPSYTNNVPPTSPVGDFAPNEYGLYDMVGNVRNWVWDWHDPDYYAKAEASQPDPRGPSSGTWRMTRGGGWIDQAEFQRCASRYMPGPPYNRMMYLGSW